MGRLEVRIYEARNLPDKQLVGKPSPYARARLLLRGAPGNTQSYKTRVCADTITPVWGETFKFDISDENSSQIKIEVWNKNLVSDDLMGQYLFSLAGLTRGVEREQWIVLQQCASNSELRVGLLAVDFGPLPAGAAAAPATPSPPPAAVAPAPAPPMVNPYPAQVAPFQLPPQAQPQYYPPPPAAMPMPAAVPHFPPAVPPAPIVVPELQPWVRYNLSRDDYDHIVAVFLNFDVGDRGVLGRAELGRLARHLNYAHSEADVDAMFRSMDRDGSRGLTLHEFCSWLAQNRPDPRALYGLGLPEYNTLMFQFRKFDTSGDGMLGKEEFVRFALSTKMADDAPTARVMFDSLGFGTAVSLHSFLVLRAQQHGATLTPSSSSPIFSRGL